MIRSMVSKMVRSMITTVINPFDGLISRYFITLDPVLQSHYEMAAPITFSGDFEIEVEFSTTSAGSQGIISAPAGVDQYIRITNGNIKIKGSSGELSDSTTQYNDNKLHNLKVISIDNTSTSVYLDGVLLMTGNPIGNIEFAVLGSYVGGYFDGIIANAKFTDKSGASDVVTTFKLDNSPAAENYIYGSEEVVNGDFATDLSGWTVYTQTAVWSVDGIVINASAGTAQVSQLLSLQANSTYEVSLKNVSKTNVRIMLGTDWWRNDQYSSDNSNEYIKFYVTPTVSSVWIQLNIGYGGMATLDNVSVKKITNAVEYKNIPQSARELYSLEDDTWVGSNELVVNGDFATDSDWDKGTGWTISGGKANAISQPSYSNLSQNNVIQLGKTYEVTFTISNYINGLARILVGGLTNVGDGTPRSGNGTYTENIESDGTKLYIRGESFTGSIDNVSIKEIIEVAS